MKSEGAPHKHLQKFHRWKNVHPPAVKVAAELVESELVSTVLAEGFDFRSVRFGDPKDFVERSEIHLERQNGDTIDYVTFSFAKYRRPSFQVHFGKRKLDREDFRFMGNLVRKPSQYYFFWCKPWWVPTVIWSDRCTRKSVQAASGALGQAFHFLKTGIRGPNIGKSIHEEKAPSQVSQSP